MKKVFKKSIACLIAVLMVFSAMPFTALAATAMYITTGVTVKDYENCYGAVYFNGQANDYAVSVLKEVGADGVITVNKGESFSITQSFGYWTDTSNTSNGNTAIANNGLFWHYGDKNSYTIGINGYASATIDGKPAQTAIEGGSLSNNGGGVTNLRAGSGNEGQRNEATFVYKFDPNHSTGNAAFLNTAGTYTMNITTPLGFYKWGTSWSLQYNNTSAIQITVRVVDTYTFNCADGRTATVKATSAAEALTMSGVPANTAKKYENYSNGTHNIIEYNWPSTPDANNVFTETSSEILGFCTGGTATCTSAAICDYCKTAYGSALGHSYTTYTVTKEATCSATGTKVASCDSGCGGGRYANYCNRPGFPRLGCLDINK